LSLLQYRFFLNFLLHLNPQFARINKWRSCHLTVAFL
jgi:hypothetical protein